MAITFDPKVLDVTLSTPLLVDEARKTIDALMRIANEMEVAVRTVTTTRVRMGRDDEMRMGQIKDKLEHGNECIRRLQRIADELHKRGDVVPFDTDDYLKWLCNGRQPKAASRDLKKLRKETEANREELLELNTDLKLLDWQAQVIESKEGARELPPEDDVPFNFPGQPGPSFMPP